MKKIMLALLLTVVFVAPAFSQNKKFGTGGMGQMDRMDDMMGLCISQIDKIGLSEDQMAKIRPVHDEMQKKRAQFKADLRIADIELTGIMDVKDFDIDKAGTVIKRISDTKTVHHLEILKSMKEMRMILTDDQFQKMKTIKPVKIKAKKPAKKKAVVPQRERTILDNLKQ